MRKEPCHCDSTWKEAPTFRMDDESDAQRGAGLTVGWLGRKTSPTLTCNRGAFSFYVQDSKPRSLGGGLLRTAIF